MNQSHVVWHVVYRRDMWLICRAMHQEALPLILKKSGLVLNKSSINLELNYLVMPRTVV